MIRTLFIAVLALLMPGLAMAACTSEAEPNDAPETATSAPDGAFCLKGAIAGGDQDFLGFAVETPGLWTLRLETVPGSVGLVELISLSGGDVRKVWSGEADPATGLVESPPLLLSKGHWVLAAGAPSTGMRWRIYGEPATALPPLAPPEVTDAFTVSLTTGDDPTSLPWTLTTGAAAQLWDLSLQAPADTSPTLEIYAGDTYLGVVRGGWNLAEPVRSIDRALQAGSYRLDLRGLPPGTPVILSAAPSLSDVASEPDTDTPHPIGPGQSLRARLYEATGLTEKDRYSFTVGAEPDQLVIAVDAPGPVTVTLQSADGSDIANAAMGTGSVRLGPYRLPPGSYTVTVDGNLGLDQTYTISLDRAPPLAPGQEAEPNDRAAFAYGFAANDTLSGHLGGTEADYVALMIPEGDLQWWTVAIAGSDVTATLLDGMQNSLASANSNGTGTQFARIPLAPGRNVIKLQGSGDWTITASAVAAPGPGDEQEINDDPLHANSLTSGQPLRLWLDHRYDEDNFSATLTAAQMVRLHVTLPIDTAPDATLKVATQPGWITLSFAQEGAAMVGKWQGVVPAGRLDLRVRGGGFSADAGQVSLTLSPPFAAQAQGAIAPEGRLAPGLAQSQVYHGEAVFEATNPAAKVVGWVSDGAFRMTGLPATGTRLPFAIEAPPWLEPGAKVQFAVVLLDPATGEALALATGNLAVDPAAPPLNPLTAGPLPGALLGALDAARSDFGATPAPGAEALTDGQLDGSEVDLAQPVEIDLAGNAPLPVLGLVLTPPSVGDSALRLRGFRIEASTGGEYTPVYEGEIDALPHPQAIAFTTPVPATSLRLTVLSTYGGGDAPAVLSEFVVLVPPDALPDPFDLARPELGGHIVIASPSLAPLVGESAYWPGTSVSFPDPGAEVVMGFYRGRAARISDIAMTDDQPGTALTVYAGLQGPLGPWERLGDLNAAQGLHLPAPVWARYLRFVFTAPVEDAYMPASISVTEAREKGATILGEWGPGAASAYEQTRDTQSQSGIAAGTDAASAPDLPALALGQGTVGADQFFTLTPPPDALTLILHPQSDGAEFTLADRSGAPVPQTAGADTLTAALSPGQGPYLLTIHKPADAIVVSWDTSLSVASFAPPIIAAVQEMSRNLAEGTQVMNFVPFRNSNGDGTGKPLLDDFATHSAEAMAALQAYPGIDSDSDGEAALIVASRALATQPGRHSVILITDASFLNGHTAETWATMQAARTRVYALRIPTATRDPAARRQAELMQDWANFNGGNERIFADPLDAATAFRDLAAELRRPIDYQVSWSFETTPPAPGRLAVTLPPDAAPLQSARAVEVILDASGSMLQRVGGKRKIEIAKTMLTALVADTLPEGTPFALRVFGIGGKGSCEGSAVLPLGPLQAGAAITVIKALKAKDGAKTAIGASLRAAAGDLAATDGSLIVLITDGEETCDGDPEAEIRALRESGFDVQLNIVGFDLDDAALKTQFRDWSKAGGGVFFEAADANALQSAITASVAPAFRLIGADGAVVAKGQVDGTPVEAPAGTYDVVIETTPERVIKAVEIPAGETVTVSP